MRCAVWGSVLLIGLLTACGTGTDGGDRSPRPSGAEGSPSAASDGERPVVFDVQVSGAAPGATSRITYSTGDSVAGHTVTVSAMAPWTHTERVSADAGLTLTVTVDNPTAVNPADPFAASVPPRVSCSITVPGRPVETSSGDGVCTVFSLEN